MKNYVTLIVVAVLALLIAFWVGTTRIAKAPIGGEACTQEAKLCPDGSAVGRTGPNCEFAACPAAGTTNTLAIGANAVINGITIGVLNLVEDSRCPVDVQCIQAGTVRVRTSVDSSNITFTLSQPQVVGNATITLVSVIPAQKYAKVTVQPSDYRFTFTVVPIVTTTSTSGVRGTVSLGPTCPVVRDPPDPQCADKPYATTIVVHRAGSSATFATGKSGADGTFQFSLPSGSYTLVAAGGTMLPRCSPMDVIVPASGYITADISCDTGIR